MFKAEYEATQHGILVKFSKVKQGWSLFGRSKVSNSQLEEWSENMGASGVLARAEIARIIDSGSDNIIEDETGLTLSYSAIAKLTNNTLRALNLPEHPTFVFGLEQKGSLRSGDLRLHPVWTLHGQRIRTKQEGPFLEHGNKKFTLPEPIYSIYGHIEELKLVTTPDPAVIMAIVSRVLTLVCPENFNRVDDELETHLSENDSIQIRLDNALENFKVRTARAMSFDVHLKNRHGYRILPVLFSDAGENVSSESQGLLGPLERTTFESDPKIGFLSSPEAKQTYKIDSGDYILIDENLMPALAYVRQIEDATPKDREEFAKNPRRAIADLYRQKLDEITQGTESEDFKEAQLEEILAQILVETKEYSDRVTELGLWKPPVLPWIKKNPNTWKPEEFGIYLGGQFVPLAPERIRSLKSEIAHAIKNQQPTVEIEGVNIPATEEVLGILNTLVASIDPPPQPPTLPRPQPKEITVLKIKDNLGEFQYQRSLTPRSPNTDTKVPAAVRTKLYRHQEVSFDWQIKAYLDGLPGLLNADDQGLGKTLQTISFMAWLQKNMSAGPANMKKPILVVAPASLLKTWGDEVDEHLKKFSLGSRIDAYGKYLKQIKKNNPDGTTRFELGLNTGRENDRICWVLTTYETLTEQQLEFAKIDFGLVVFDEIQKIKNVTTRAHHAAKSLKTDFIVGLTGTPVENDMSDLWAIMDTIAPGLFGSLKEFLSDFNDLHFGIHKKIYDKIFKPSSGHAEKGSSVAPVGIRRLKSDELKELPNKSYKYHQVAMPDAQYLAYDTVFASLTDLTKGDKLRTLHRLRSVSLYPDNLQILTQKTDKNSGFDLASELMEKSARFQAVFEILDQIKAKNEKALVFLETHDMQYLVREALTKKYSLPNVRILNGQTTLNQRNKIVKEFQATMGDGQFDIRILSPRAAGVGLTLTAATHIIHLSRWWNPAVEEQCNDRIYRIGQRHDCTIHIPIAYHPYHLEQSFDCTLNNMMIEKRNLFREALQPPVDARDDPSMLIGALTGSKFDIKIIDQNDWLAFEKWAADMARKSGKWEVSNTPRTGDAGADVHMKHKESKNVVLVQCKWTGDISKQMNDAPINEVLHSATRYDVSKGHLCVVITNADGFDHRARSLAKEKNVKLIARKELALWPNHVV